MGASLTFRRIGLYAMLVIYLYVCIVGNCVLNVTLLFLTCVVVCVVDSASVIVGTLGDAALSPVSATLGDDVSVAMDAVSVDLLGIGGLVCSLMLRSLSEMFHNSPRLSASILMTAFGTVGDCSSCTTSCSAAA